VNDRRAFTLVEAVIVLALTGLLSVVAAVAIGSAMNGVQITSAADKLVSDLRYAQTMASGVGVWYGVSFESGTASRYYIYTTTGTLDTLVDNPGKKGSSFVVELGTDFGVTIATATIEGGSKVEFSPYQVPYTDRTGAALSGEAVITLQKSGAVRTVRITPTAGRIYTQ
jgi:Tfp pilus assembly protein FimT